MWCRRSFARLALFMTVSAASGSCAGELPRDVVHIRTSQGASITVPVEVAATPAARARGLMARSELPVDEGMWFDFGQPGRVAMWMKNTLVPLDMLFVGSDCRVVHVVEGAIPESLDIHVSLHPARWVLEVNAGFIARTGAGLGSCARLGSAVPFESPEGLSKPLE